MKYLLCIVIGYLLGCISPSYFIGKAKGYDIRDLGTRNAGASNVTMSFGWKYGVLTALLDILKAFLAVKIANFVCPDDMQIAMISGSAAVMGHFYPFYMHFKGGKGFSSITGMCLALNWKVALTVIIISILLTLVTGYIVVATVFAVCTYIIYFFVTKAPIYGWLSLLLIGSIILYKHRANIKRILNGTEYKLFDVGKHRVKDKE